jgi:hypothetical protein
LRQRPKATFSFDFSSLDLFEFAAQAGLRRLEQF